MSPISTTSKAPSLRLTCGFPATGTSPALRRTSATGHVPEAQYNDSLVYGYNRAKVAWYVDPLFQRDQPGITPADIDDDDQSNNFVREIPQREIFPNVSQPTGPQVITCMNLAYYPTERGLQHDVDSVPGLSAGIDTDGRLRDPASRWGGIMRRLETTDFRSEQHRVHPVLDDGSFATGTENDGSGGELYFNLGNLSEDILRRT